MVDAGAVQQALRSGTRGVSRSPTSTASIDYLRYTLEIVARRRWFDGPRSRNVVRGGVARSTPPRDLRGPYVTHRNGLATIATVRGVVSKHLPGTRTYMAWPCVRRRDPSDTREGRPPHRSPSSGHVEAYLLCQICIKLTFKLRIPLRGVASAEGLTAAGRRRALVRGSERRRCERASWCPGRLSSVGFLSSAHACVTFAVRLRRIRGGRAFPAWARRLSAGRDDDPCFGPLLFGGGVTGI